MLSQAQPAAQKTANKTTDTSLDELLKRVNDLVGKAASDEPTLPSEYESPAAQLGLTSAIEEEQRSDAFLPIEPQSLKEAGLTDSEVEALVLKMLLGCGESTGRNMTEHLKLPFALMEQMLRQMKVDQLVAYKASAPMNDYVYQLTEIGRERARRCVEHCSYYGASPVSLKDYIASVKAQSIEGQHPTMPELKKAFDDLLISPAMFARLGPAVNSGRGMFLYGFPGNGKTSIAERVTRAFGRYIWIPRALGVDGEIIRLFDPMNHNEAPLERSVGLFDQSRIDKRWVRIERPTIIAGGELTMENLEVALNTSTGISESPLQLKSNCGTLVIDDFGRQKMSVDELLNRWIVPLEKRYDFLNLANGRKIQVPFDQLIVFSTNLEPKDLVDDAFLRRIPYKIEVPDPTEQEFRELFNIMCRVLKIPYSQGPIDYLVEKHYKAVNRPFRCCQPRDLLFQIKNHCLYHDVPIELSNQNFDFAVDNYFSVM